MLQWTERPIGNIPYASDGLEHNLIIPRDNAIRRVYLRFDFNLTNPAGAPTFTEDDIFNLIKKIRIEEDGANNRINLNGRMWFYIEYNEKETKPNYVAPVTTVSTTYDATVTLIADFATDRDNEFDISAILQTKKLSNLLLWVTWGLQADLASANAPTINASTNVEVEIREVYGTFDWTHIDKDGNQVTDKGVDVNDPDTYQPKRYTETFTTVKIDANHASFDDDSLTYSIAPTPSNIVSQAMMVLDQNGLKNNSIVTQFKVQRESPYQLRHIQRKWLSMWDSKKVQQKLSEGLTIGFIFLDWIQESGGTGLINNTKDGDIKYRFLIAGFSAGQTINIFTRSFPIASA